MRRFQETVLGNPYWLFDVAVKSVLQAKDLEKDEDDSNDGSYGHSILHIEVDESINLTACVEVYLYEGVVPVKVNQLLE